MAAWLAWIPSRAAAQTDAGNRPFIGLWKLNVDKSHPHVPPGFAVYRQFQDDGGGWMSHTVITITPRGSYFLFTTARYDGKPYPDYTGASLGNFVRHGTKPPQTVTFTRVNSHQIRWTDKVNGRTVAGGTETVSADGKMLTMTDHVPGRKTVGVQVFDRLFAARTLQPAPRPTSPVGRRP